MMKSVLMAYPSQKVHVVDDDDEATGAAVDGAAETGAEVDGGDDTTIGVSMTVANGAAVDGADDTGATVTPPFAPVTMVVGASDVGAALDGASDVGEALDGAAVVIKATDGASVVSGREKSTLRLNETPTSRNCNTRASLKDCPSRAAAPFFSLLYTWIFRRRFVSDTADVDDDAAWLDARVEMAMAALINFIVPYSNNN